MTSTSFFKCMKRKCSKLCVVLHLKQGTEFQNDKQKTFVVRFRRYEFTFVYSNFRKKQNLNARIWQLQISNYKIINHIFIGLCVVASVCVYACILCYTFDCGASFLTLQSQYVVLTLDEQQQ